MEGSEGGLLAFESSRLAFPAREGQWLPQRACDGHCSITVAGPRRYLTELPCPPILDYLAGSITQSPTARHGAAQGVIVSLVTR
jgi:hypothetical protein